MHATCAGACRTRDADRRAQFGARVGCGCDRPSTPSADDGNAVAGSGAAELKLVPGRNGCDLEERSVSLRVAVRELGRALVPGDFEQILLDAVIEPGAPEDELAK